MTEAIGRHEQEAQCAIDDVAVLRLEDGSLPLGDAARVAVLREVADEMHHPRRTRELEGCKHRRARFIEWIGHLPWRKPQMGMAPDEMLTREQLADRGPPYPARLA